MGGARLGGLKSAESLLFPLWFGSGESCLLKAFLDGVGVGGGVASFSTLTIAKLTGEAGRTAFHLKLISGLSSVISMTIGASSKMQVKNFYSTVVYLDHHRGIRRFLALA